MKDDYFRIATTLFGILVIVVWKVYQCHLNHKHWDKYTAVITFAYIISDYMLNKNLNKPFHEYVNTTMIFIFGLIMDDRGSNEANNTPDTYGFIIDIEVLDISLDGYCSDLSSALGESYNNIKITFLF